MTEDTALATAEYIARVSLGETVRLHWFGGEPLVNRKAIDLICGALERKGIRFESGMTSNGYYLDKETVDHAVRKWKLKNVQITLDGTEKTYNTGSIRNDDRDESVIQKWKEPLLVPECGNCAMYPKCRKLAMCESYKNGCSDLDRRVDLIEVKEQMLKTYQGWKKGQDETSLQSA